MSILDVVFLRLGDIGRGLRRSTVNPGTIEVAPSTQAGNQLGFGPDGGLSITTTTIVSAALPAVDPSQVGSTLGVQADGTWGVDPFSGPIVDWPAIV